MSPKFELLKSRWAMGWISKETLRGWVAINEKRPGAGITPEEYETITGEVYE